MKAFISNPASKYLLIGCGGFFGAIARALVKGLQINGYQGALPLNTLFINIAGAFLLGLVMTIVLEIREFNEGVKLGITTGFLGAFTTFSAVCRETAALLSSGDSFTAVSYIIISSVFGISAVWLGMKTVRTMALLKQSLAEKAIAINEAEPEEATEMPEMQEMQEMQEMHDLAVAPELAFVPGMTIIAEPAEGEAD
ncbi:MAG: fluoride efflux transporter CrcB [Clostridiales bacterium]|nr:fluoride efflux transporter CrcB [Clostridiales bacterium]